MSEGATAARGSHRPLTARSVLASVLLGTEPPMMSPRSLVRAGELFGLSEGTVRTALSRMTAAGELERTGEGRYRLVGHLVGRQQRQTVSRRADVRPWGGAWVMWVVESAARPAPERAALREAARAMRLGELRDGVWLRPDNLPGQPAGAGSADAETTGAIQIMRGQARRFLTYPDHDDVLAGELWDLESWNKEALELRREMHSVERRVGDSDSGALRDAFVLAAAVLRHFNADPLLPRELATRDYQGQSLRHDFDAFDGAFRAALGRWLARDDSVAVPP